MIKETLNLVMALTSVAITLLDPIMQLANGVDLDIDVTNRIPSW